MIAALALVAFWQSTPAPPVAKPDSGTPGSELTVTLLTYETGPKLFERFGHNAIWIHDAGTGTDTATDRHYDYGRFSFEQTNFFLRFAQGKMWYSMGEDSDPGKYIRFYIGQGRKVIAQVLSLTPDQRKRLRDFLEWNILPEHAGYAYDYYRDNCSTRIRDALDQVLGGAIKRYGGGPSGYTWREETARLNQHSVGLYTGYMVMLGEPVDQGMTKWEQMFLPGRLSEHLDSLVVSDSAGGSRKLVRSREVLSLGGRYPVPLRPRNWTLGFLIVGAWIGGSLAWLGGGGSGLRRTLFLLLGTLWALVAGILGIVVTWLWVLSTHRVAHHNENLLLFNLFGFVLALVLPSAIRGRAWARMPARRLALVVTLLAALGLLLKLLPGFPQKNLELIALALPAHAGLYLGLTGREPS